MADKVLLLSEIDPLSVLALPEPDTGPVFRPTDMIYGMRAGLRPLDDRALIRVFLGSLRQLRGVAEERGLALVIRDHTHSQYCTTADPAGRPTMREIMERTGPVLPLASVRHPLDSFLSLEANHWEHFQPFTLEEYARRYLLFAEDYAGVPMIRYEDMVTDPDKVLGRACKVLELPFSSRLVKQRHTVRLSGDSGRRSGALALRPRRPISDAIAPMLADIAPGDAYHDLCDRLGYDPDPEAAPVARSGPKVL